MINPSRPGGQGLFQQVRAVGREQERHIGVRAESVHLVEQLEQHRLLAVVGVAVLGDQVHVLDHDHRGLQGTGHRAGRADVAQGRAGNDDDRGPQQLSDQVTDGMRLASPRCAVQQQAPLEVLSAGPEHLCVPGDAEHMALDAVEQGGRQDDPGPVQLRSVQKGQQRAVAVTEYLAAEPDDVAAVHVALDGEPPDLVNHALCRGLVLGADLHAHPGHAAVRVRVPAPASPAGCRHHG